MGETACSECNCYSKSKSIKVTVWTESGDSHLVCVILDRSHQKVFRLDAPMDETRAVHELYPLNLHEYQAFNA